MVAAVDAEASRENRELTQGCEALATARAANDEAHALDLTVRLWEEFHAAYTGLRPRAFEAADDVAVPLVSEPTPRVEALYREISARSDEAERLARRALGAYLRRRIEAVANAQLAPIVDGALDAARNRAIATLGNCAPRIVPALGPRASSKASAREGASDAPR